MEQRQGDWQRLVRDLRSEFQLREDELELVHAIDLRLLEEDLSLEETLSFIADRTKALLRAEHVSILLKRGSVLEVTYSSDGLDIGKIINVSGSIAGKVLTERSPVFIPDLRKSALRKGYVRIAGYSGPEITSVIEVPIIIHGSALGVFCVESARANSFSKLHIRIMQDIAAQAAIALQNVEHFASAALLADVDRMILSQASTQEVIQRVLQRVTDELHMLHHVELNGVAISFRKGDHELEIVHSTSPGEVGLVLSIDESISGRAVREGRTVNVADVNKDPEYRRLLGSKIQSEIAVPITLADNGVIIGVLNVESTEIDAFSGFPELVLERFADRVRTVLAFAKLRTDVTDALESRHASDMLVAVGDQTSNLVHRLNNKVGALRGMALLMQEALDEPSLDREFLRDRLAAILELAEQTLAMPDEVARFLSQEGNTIDVNKMVSDVLSEARPPANITVATDFDPHLPELSLYSFDIVVQNLIKNAIDAMPHGGKLTVSTKLYTPAELKSGYVQLTVEDTGHGIPEDIRPHIFDLNFTTKRQKGKGLGFGLWWVRNFVLRSQGEISVDSKSSGTEFIVKIPIKASTNSNTKRPRSDR